jgi:hypothetical protein
MSFPVSPYICDDVGPGNSRGCSGWDPISLAIGVLFEYDVGGTLPIGSDDKALRFQGRFEIVIGKTTEKDRVGHLGCVIGSRLEITNTYIQFLRPTYAYAFFIRAKRLVAPFALIASFAEFLRFLHCCHAKSQKASIHIFQGVDVNIAASLL